MLRWLMALSRLGLDLAVASPWRLPQLNAVVIPDGKDDAKIRSHLLNEFNLEIGAGLGDLAGQQWRIGLMGSSSHQVNINQCLAAFESALALLSLGIGARAQIKARRAALKWRNRVLLHSVWL